MNNNNNTLILILIYIYIYLVWSLKIFWKGESELDSFSLKCRNEEQLKLWQSTIEKLQNDMVDGNIASVSFPKNSSEPNSTPPIKRTGVSNTQLASLQNLELPIYPRHEDDDAASFIDEEDDEEEELDEEEEEDDDEWE